MTRRTALSLIALPSRSRRLRIVIILPLPERSFTVARALRHYLVEPETRLHTVQSVSRIFEVK